jgi:hypothetical protein
MKKAYCDFCGKKVVGEVNEDRDAYSIPSVFVDEDEEDGHTEDIISYRDAEDCCLSCARKFDDFVASLRKA